MTTPDFDRLLSQTSHGVLATIKRDGRPQLSNVNHAYDPSQKLLRISITADRAKARNLRRDPRASYHVSAPDFWQWAVAEGTAELTPVAQEEYDDTVNELVEFYRVLRGEHPDWDEYRRAMVVDGRQLVRLRVEHVYGQVQ